MLANTCFTVCNIYMYLQSSYLIFIHDANGCILYIHYDYCCFAWQILQECFEEIYILIWFNFFLWHIRYSEYSHISILSSPAYFHFAAQTYIYTYLLQLLSVKSAFLILLKNWSVTQSLPQFIQHVDLFWFLCPILAISSKGSLKLISNSHWWLYGKSLKRYRKGRFNQIKHTKCT